VTNIRKDNLSKYGTILFNELSKEILFFVFCFPRHLRSYVSRALIGMFSVSAGKGEQVQVSRRTRCHVDGHARARPAPVPPALSCTLLPMVALAAMDL
jgi:hypothetical protein